MVKQFKIIVEKHSDGYIAYYYSCNCSSGRGPGGLRPAQIWFQIPALRQATNWSCTVFHGGKRDGSSFQPQSVCIT